MKDGARPATGFDDPADLVEGMSEQEINRQMAQVKAEAVAGSAPSATTAAPAPGPKMLDPVELLDLGPREGSQEPRGEPQAPAQPVAPAAAPEPDAGGESGLQTRVRELAERYRRLEEQNAQLVQRFLDGGQPAGAPAVDLDQPPAGMAPETYEYLKPIIDPLKAEIRQLRAQVAPVLEKSGNDALTDHLVRNVEGFTEEMMPQLRAAFQGLSPAEQQAYGRDGVSAEGLAHKIVRSAGGGAPRPATPDHRSRMQGDLGGGAQRTDSGQGGESVALKKLAAMSDADFDKLLNKTDQSFYQ